jgi:drug/metabolite transporter (DMT)-like permease
VIARGFRLGHWVEHRYNPISLSFILDISWGILTLLMWGIADFLVRVVAIRIGSVSTAFFVQVIGLAVPGGAVAVLLLSSGMGDVSWATIAWLAPLNALLAGFAYMAYYTGLQRGSISVVSSVASAWLLVAVLVAALVLGESVSVEQQVLIGVVLVGILTIGVQPGSGSGKNSGIGYGLAAMVLLGIALALSKPLTEAAGPYLGVLTARALASMVTLGLMRARSLVLTWPSTRLGVRILVCAALLDAGGFVTYNIGLERAPVVLIAPLAAAHPLGTILLAMLVLRERPGRFQAIGIALTLIGVLALSVVLER